MASAAPSLIMMQRVIIRWIFLNGFAPWNLRSLLLLLLMMMMMILRGGTYPEARRGPGSGPRGCSSTPRPGPSTGPTPAAPGKGEHKIVQNRFGINQRIAWTSAPGKGKSEIDQSIALGSIKKSLWNQRLRLERVKVKPIISIALDSTNPVTWGSRGAGRARE
jgi:hypothetical protein